MTKRKNLHTAKFIVATSDKIYENGYILEKDGIIEDVVKSAKNIKKSDFSDYKIIDHGDGVIIPSLVNAHTHLDLSAFKGKIPMENGFKSWVKELLRQRSEASVKEMQKAADNGLKEIIASGCSLAADISSIGITKDIFLNSKLPGGVFFEEKLGENTTDKLGCKIYENKKLSYAGHAPHTTSPALLLKLKNAAKKMNLPFSVHLSESEDEIEFITTGKGDWALFLKERKIDFKNWNLPAKSPIAHLSNCGILDEKTIAVHVTIADKNDYDILKENDTWVCLCLRSNQNLHKRLPDINSMIEKKLNLCIGTDSLASVDSLSIFDEMKFIYENFPEINPKKIFEMGTIAGAKALGFEKDFGTIEKGKKASFIYLPLKTGKAKRASAIMERIIYFKAL